MKLLLYILAISASALATEPSSSFKALKQKQSLVLFDNTHGAGAAPIVQADYIPGFIAHAIKRRASNPNALEIVSWTMPKLITQPYAGGRIGHWQMTVTARGTNAYGAVVTNQYDVAVVGSVVRNVIQH